MSSFTSLDPETRLKIVVATIAFGMGIDCPNICRVFHFGPPNCVESYIQETGRTGRDGLLSTATLFHHIGRRLSMDDCIKSYTNNTNICRRDFLFQDFEEYQHSNFGTKCSCCDICISKCDEKGGPTHRSFVVDPVLLLDTFGGMYSQLFHEEPNDSCPVPECNF